MSARVRVRHGSMPELGLQALTLGPEIDICVEFEVGDHEHARVLLIDAVARAVEDIRRAGGAS